ncbi:hypothetical protein [Pseudobdellovibrio exovorus]|uniref:DUF4251 domain-containing protein n=1 Tax=Pseudobdellovibrio exovorus JSS TaxID=1184267 RepID=M4VAI8_9BACT|nr:hypothetical protein [Pseudobdellovibrio exovorus]AGH96422.1 hypothetical protein A11Q_2206 [Pseudobdellovibrio exovorus JSS]
MKSVIFVLLMSLGVQAFAQEATQIMAQIRAENKQRFNQNGFINDPALTARFSASQKAAIARLRANGNLKRAVRITNNVMSGLVVTVSIVQERNGQFAGVLVERSRYNGAIDEANLRLFNIPILLNGMGLFSHNGVTMVSIKSRQLSASQGGRMVIRYPTNIKNQTFSEESFDIMKSVEGEMNFYTTSRVGFTRIEVQAWMNLFTQNGGVEKVTLR